MPIGSTRNNSRERERNNNKTTPNLSTSSAGERYNNNKTKHQTDPSIHTEPANACTHFVGHRKDNIEEDGQIVAVVTAALKQTQQTVTDSIMALSSGIQAWAKNQGHKFRDAFWCMCVCVCVCMHACVCVHVCMSILSFITFLSFSSLCLVPVLSCLQI